MRAWIKPFTAGLMTSAALLIGVAAWSDDLPSPMAAMHHHGDPAAHEAMFKSMIVKNLDLDAAQTARLDALIAKVHAQHENGPADFHTQLLTLVQGNSLDRAGAQTLVDTHLQKMREAAPTIIAAAGDFYDGLRPDQQQKMRDFMASHHGPMDAPSAH
jgi:Spy/CpxP family protein refolding chaperone